MLSQIFRARESILPIATAVCIGVGLLVLGSHAEAAGIAGTLQACF